MRLRRAILGAGIIILLLVSTGAMAAGWGGWGAHMRVGQRVRGEDGEGSASGTCTGVVLISHPNRKSRSSLSARSFTRKACLCARDCNGSDWNCGGSGRKKNRMKRQSTQN